MSDESVNNLPAPIRRFIQVIGAIEDWVGIFFAMLLVLIVISYILMMAQLTWYQETWPRRLCWILAGMVWLHLDLRYLCRLALVAHRRLKPYTFQVAVRQQMPSIFFRPLVGIWWLAHFAIGFCFALMSHDLKTASGASLNPFFSLLMAACYGYAANGFLMLAVCAFTGSEGFRQAIWRSRALIDIGLALLSLIAWRF